MASWSSTCWKAVSTVWRYWATAFQQVEDQLATQRILAQEAPFRTESSQAADAAERIALNQYRAGTAIYTTVVVAQAAAYNARTSLIQNQLSQIVASINLVTALGGGWSASELPKD